MKTTLLNPSLKRSVLQACDLDPSADQDEADPGTPGLQQGGRLQDRFQPLRLAHVAGEDDTEPVGTRESRRQSSARRSERFLVGPVVDHVDLPLGHAALHQQPLEPGRQHDDMVHRGDKPSGRAR